MAQEKQKSRDPTTTPLAVVRKFFLREPNARTGGIRTHDI